MNYLYRFIDFAKKYLPMFLLMAYSGNPFITNESYSNNILIIYFLSLLIFVLFEVDFNYVKKIIYFTVFSIIFIGVIVFFQQMLLGFVSYPGVFSFLIKMLIGLYTLIYYQHKKLDFLDIYIKVISFLLVISIPFWILNQFEYLGLDIGSVIKRSQLLYTSFIDDPSFDLFVRNSGMFWEPGAHAGYLIVGLLFVALKNRKFMFGPYKNEVLIMSAGLLTTVSTTGFIAFGIILVMFSIHNYGLANIVVLPVFLIIIGIAYFKLDFLKDKVESQFQDAVEMSDRDISAARMGALKMDIQYMKSQPFTGNGFHIRTRYRLHPWITEDPLQGNGMSNIMAVWGIPFFVIWLICLSVFAWKTSLSTVTTGATVFIIVLILQGEQYINYPLFLSFFYMPFIYKNILSKESKVFLINYFFKAEFS